MLGENECLRKGKFVPVNSDPSYSHSFAPCGAYSFSGVAHRLRGGLHSLAAPRLQPSTEGDQVRGENECLRKGTFVPVEFGS